MKDLKDYTDDELRDELKRRTKDRRKMVRKYDTKILKGDVFECIQEVCKNNIHFRKGETYKAYIDNHIANEQIQNCYFEPYECDVFFKRI